MDRKEKILIVEDEENIREELREYLSGFGYEVSVLTDFSDAAESALREHPDLILMDVNIPGMNGIAVCERIRKSSQVPVIFVTANDTPVDELECIMRGGDDYVAKPYRLPILTARIAAVLRRMSGKTQGRVQETTADVTTDAAAERVQAVLSSPGKKIRTRFCSFFPQPGPHGTQRRYSRYRGSTAGKRRSEKRTYKKRTENTSTVSISIRERSCPEWIFSIICGITKCSSTIIR